MKVKSRVMSAFLASTACLLPACSSKDGPTDSKAAASMVARDDLKALEGRWAEIYSESVGAAAPEEDVKGLFMRIDKAGQVTYEYQRKRDPAVQPPPRMRSTWKWDFTTSPKSFDIITKETVELGGMKQEFILNTHGIFKLEGDRLTLCQDNERPKEFKTVAGSPVILSIWERVK